MKKLNPAHNFMIFDEAEVGGAQGLSLSFLLSLCVSHLTSIIQYNKGCFAGYVQCNEHVSVCSCCSQQAEKARAYPQPALVGDLGQSILRCQQGVCTQHGNCYFACG